MTSTVASAASSVAASAAAPAAISVVSTETHHSGQVEHHGWRHSGAAVRMLIKQRSDRCVCVCNASDIRHEYLSNPQSCRHEAASESLDGVFLCGCASGGSRVIVSGGKRGGRERGKRMTSTHAGLGKFCSDHNFVGTMAGCSTCTLMTGGTDLSALVKLGGFIREKRSDGRVVAAAAPVPSSPGGPSTTAAGNPPFGAKRSDSKTKPTSTNALAITEAAKTALSDSDILLCTPGLGAILDGQGGCVFRVWAPNAEAAFVVLHDEVSIDGQCGKMIPLERQGAFWAQRLRNVKAGDKYHYVFRHQGKDYARRDARARHTDYDSNACIITDPKYDWYPFEAPSLEKMMIYQLHVGAFTGRDAEGSFMDAEGKLDHIKELGFNTIQLLPVHEFSGEWGYNPRLLCAIHQKYGTPEQLRHFVNECHIRGIAVIFEVVLNHMATNLNSLWAYDGINTEGDGGLYFDRAFDTGSSRGFAYEEREVREMIMDAARMFLSEYKGDGLRIHAVQNMPRDVLEDMTTTLHEEFPGKVLISDISPENPKVVSRGGFDSTIIHSTYFDMRKHMRGDLDGQKLEKAVGLHYGFTKPSQCIKHFLGAHDHIGDRNDGMFDVGIDGFHRFPVDLFGGRAKWEANAAARAWYMVMSLSAGIPLLFMGTEFSHDGWWGWGVRQDECINWTKAEDETGKTMMKLIKAANEMRRESPAILHGTVDVVHYDENHGIIGFWRKSEKEWLFVVANLSSYQWSEEEYEVRVGHCGTGHKFMEVFNCQAAEYGGWEGSGNAGKKLKEMRRRIRVNLPQWSVLVFEPTD